MNLRTTLALFASALICLVSFASLATAAPLSPAANQAIGSLPSTPPAPAAKKKKVSASEEHTNQDGVKTEVDDDSRGSATIDPAEGDQDSATTVKTRTGFKGKVSGIDSNDTVDLGSSSKATISGTGGTIVLKGGCSVTITNTGSGSEGGVIRVVLAGGDVIEVEPESTITINPPEDDEIYELAEIPPTPGEE